MRNEIALRSAGISYFLFFALIPIVTTLVSLVLMLPFLKVEAEQVVKHLTENLLPEAISEVHEHLVALTRNAGVICVLSITVALYLLGKVFFFFEESVNRFWGFETKRSVLRVMKKAWLLYLLAILGVAISIALPTRGAPRVAANIVITFAVFAGFNRIAPAWPHGPEGAFRWRDLLPGSLLCGSVWYLSKWGFSMYVRRFATPEHISAVLGVLPLFLAWLYFSTYMLLLSAALNSALFTFRTRARRGDESAQTFGRSAGEDFDHYGGQTYERRQVRITDPEHHRHGH